MKPTNPPSPRARLAHFDRRRFLGLSSAAALATFAPLSPGIEPPGPAPRRTPGAAANLYGRWFAV